MDARTDRLADRETYDWNSANWDERSRSRSPLLNPGGWPDTIRKLLNRFAFADSGLTFWIERAAYSALLAESGPGAAEERAGNRYWPNLPKRKSGSGSKALRSRR